MATELPDGIGDLLRYRVDGFEKLELLVALHGAPRTTLSFEDHRQEPSGRKRTRKNWTPRAVCEHVAGTMTITKRQKRTARKLVLPLIAFGMMAMMMFMEAAQRA